MVRYNGGDVKTACKFAIALQWVKNSLPLLIVTAYLGERLES